MLQRHGTALRSPIIDRTLPVRAIVCSRDHAVATVASRSTTIHIVLTRASVASQPHDGFFKRAFGSRTHATALLRAVLPPHLRDAIAWHTLRPEPGTRVDARHRPRHIDCLFSVRIARRRVFLYLLVEHQSNRRNDMPLRVLELLARVWTSERRKRSKLPITIPIVISHARGGWRRSIALWDMFEPHPTALSGLAELVPRFSFVLVDLAPMSNAQIEQLTRDAYAVLVLLALRDGRNARRLLDNLHAWQRPVQALLRRSGDSTSFADIFQYIFSVTDRLHYDAFRDKLCELVPAAEPTIMTIAEQLRREGLEQGLQQGLEQGRIEEIRRILRMLITEKFGAPSRKHQARIAEAALADLERWARRFATAATVTDVFE